MDHIAIMNKNAGLISDIISGKKTIESRWYVNKIAPWNKIQKGDVVYFKDSGSPVTAFALVDEVIQFENLNAKKIAEITQKFGGVGKINLRDKTGKFAKGKNYCILIFLKNPQSVEPFKINKAGFGSSCAWMCVGDINKVRIT